jgi:signal transduction histidine kinase
MFDVLSHYLEVNFEDVADQLAQAIARQPSGEHADNPRVVAAAHLRHLIRQLRRRGERERAQALVGAPARVGHPSVEGLAGEELWLQLPELSDLELEVLHRYLSLFLASLRRTATRPEASASDERSRTAVVHPSPVPVASLSVQERLPANARTIVEAVAFEAHSSLALDAVLGFLLSSPDRLTLRVAAPADLPPLLREVELDATTGWGAAAFASPEVVAYDDLSREAAGMGEDRWAEAGYRGFAAVALRLADGTPIGLLVGLRNAAWRIDRPDSLRLLALAREVTMALERNSLYARVDELAVAGERQKLAREIHDGLASDLAAVVALFKYFEQRRQEDPEDAESVLTQIRGMVEEVLQGARDILQALRPRTVQSEGLIAAVLKLVDEFGRAHLIETSTNVRGDDSALASEEQECIFQILRESLANIRKHALAHRVWVNLDLTHPPVVLSVRDDGRGFDVDRVTEDPQKAGSYGLLGMRERATLLGGSLEVSSRPGAGALITFYGRKVTYAG